MEKDVKVVELSDITLEEVAGGVIVDDGDGRKFWLVRQDGTVISPVPGRENAIEFAKAYNISQQVLTKEEYARCFGRELAW
jgi:hypothetical protein